MNDVPECPMNVADSSFSTLSSRNHSCSSLPQTPATRSHRSNTTSVSSGALLGTPSNGGLPLPPPPERPHPNSYDSDGSFARTQSSVYNTPLDRNVYNVPPNNEIDGPPVGNRGEEHYYNMRPHDSVYQMPPGETSGFIGGLEIIGQKQPSSDKLKSLELDIHVLEFMLYCRKKL